MFAWLTSFLIAALCFVESAAVGKTVPMERSFKTILQGNSGRDIDGESFFIVKNEQEWKKVAKEYLGAPKDSSNFDFKKNQLFVVHSGQRSGGYSLSIRSFSTFEPNSDERLKIDVNIAHPGANCIVTEALEGLYEVVLIPVKYSVAQVLFTQSSHPDCKER